MKPDKDVLKDGFSAAFRNHTASHQDRSTSRAPDTPVAITRAGALSGLGLLLLRLFFFWAEAGRMQRLFDHSLLAACAQHAHHKRAILNTCQFTSIYFEMYHFLLSAIFNFHYLSDLHPWNR